ncbi:uncharacterized protein A4U43_C01F10090 [Asparagus officinalis]|uniref:Adaptor protein ClpS core domain-containing protein n=1 Tax=Asparagus officinalis TaxID=4686 RepID=A0A5P1FS24_ASPOF|nr:ATP-dependent Clp protease adapter protein CLPS1, chloroplastic-like [Asparagus officinalis]ONK79789.1 uncharacterized protein A4U43_C01F10090 [Asparagus officinalis]
MATSSKAAAFAALMPHNATPHSHSLANVPMCFRPMSSKSEMRILVSAKGNLSSLRGGTGLLERPTFDQSQFDPITEAEEGGDIGQLRDKKSLGSGDSYKVLLIDDARHTEQLVEKALPQVVPSITVNEARKLFHESRQNGVAVVIVTVKEHAEFYAQMMIRSGLRSAIEPDSDMAA